eukprot:Opistho-1_new@61619
MRGMAARSDAGAGRLPQSVTIALVVTAYWVVSISMVFLNKYLLSSPDVQLEAPLFITWYQCIVGAACLWLSGLLAQKWPEQLSMFPQFEYRLDVALKTLPLSAIFVGMIAFNNICLKFVGIAFYNVGRSLTTVFNVALTRVFLGQHTSFPAIVCCAVIVGGFFLGVKEEGGAETSEITFGGVVAGVIASLFVALYSIFIKRVLPAVDGNEWRLSFYNNVNATFLFLPFMLFAGEFGEVYRYPQIFAPSFWNMMTVGGIFGILIAVVTMMQIKHTSPLTHTVSATAKACAQTALAVFATSQVKSPMWWLSNAMVLFGAAAYANVRHKEMQANKAPLPLPATHAQPNSSGGEGK